MSRLKVDCRYFRGSVPCSFNKKFGMECPTCHEYAPISERLLFIKLDAIGDVVRSGSLLPALRRKHPGCIIAWLTRAESSEIVSANPCVDEILLCDTEGMNRIFASPWDYVYSLSNDYPSASIAALADARKETFGFTLTEKGTLHPTNDTALHWLEMAAFDRLKKANGRSYQSLMYEMAGCTGPIERPPLVVDDASRAFAASLCQDLSNAVTIGINTGSGLRWPKKMLDADAIVALCDRLTLMRQALHIVLLGGPEETEKISVILRQVRSSERIHEVGTHHSLIQFAALIEQCDVLVCGDTLALHLATAVDTPAVAVVGPTSAAEIYDYDGAVTKLTVSELDCLVCYGDCDKTANCMSLLDLDVMTQTILRACDDR